jgi:hypothetical protein
MNKLVELKFGSHLYGTDTPNSDLDLKGIYLPEAKDILLGRYKKTVASSRPKQEGERNTKDDVDTEFFSLDRYLELLMDGQTVALDMLFAPGFRSHSITDTIYANRDKLLNKNVASFIGYTKQQASKYGIKGSRLDALNNVLAWLTTLPPRSRLSDHLKGIEKLIEDCTPLVSLEKSPLVRVVQIVGPKGPPGSIARTLLPHLEVCGKMYSFTTHVQNVWDQVNKRALEYGGRARMASIEGGIDWKALSHAVRVASEAIELLKTGHITFPCPNKSLLLSIKTGKLPYTQVAELIEQGLVDLLAAQAASSLREESDREWADNFVAAVYEEVVLENSTRVVAYQSL